MIWGAYYGSSTRYDLRTPPVSKHRAGRAGQKRKKRRNR